MKLVENYFSLQNTISALENVILERANTLPDL